MGPEGEAHLTQDYTRSAASLAVTARGAVGTEVNESHPLQTPTVRQMGQIPNQPLLLPTPVPLCPPHHPRSVCSAQPHAGFVQPQAHPGACL